MDGTAENRSSGIDERVIFLERKMNKQNSKKLNSKQKTIAVMALIVTVLLAICVTFAWYTNRINGMKGEVALGSFNYEVSLYDVATDYTVTEAGTKAYTNEKIDDTTFAQSTFQLNNFANNSVKYQVVKVTNNSGFGIKAYEYLTFGTLTEAQKTLSNYFYFKPFKLSNNATAFPDFPTTVTETSLQEYFTSHTANLPSAAAIAAVDTDWTFGNLNNNSVALERNAVSNNATEYYLLAYTLRGTTAEQIAAGGGFDLTPVIAIGQTNGPVPQTSGSAKAVYADSWYELKSAIAAANPGDTVYLTANVTSPANTGLSIDNDINLNLNGYDLTVAGDLVFNYNQKENRNLTVPAASTLTVKGDMRVSSLGAFSVTGSGASKNIVLGERVTTNGTTTVTGGNLYVNCGLAVDQKTRVANASTDAEKLTAVTDDVIVEDSGFTLNNVVVQKVTTTDRENATLTIIGSNTMVKIGSGATLNAVTADTNVSDIYIANYGTVSSLNLANVAYPTGRNYDSGLYVVNYNTVSNISLSTAARGYKSTDTAYNTRIKDADGARTSFKNIVPTSGNFKVADVEPFSSSAVENSEVLNLGGGVYEVYLRNTSLNTDTAAESISALFEQYSFDPLYCKELRVITTNAITLKTSQFTNIRDNFKNLNTIDFSKCAVADNTIPANAFNVSVSTAENKITNLQNVRLPLTEVKIGAAAFKGTNIEQITIAANVTDIGSEALHTQTNLEVTWDNSVSSILATFFNQNAFDLNKTIIFMDAGVVQDAYLNSAFTDEWKMCMYENYDFKASQYYCKYVRDGSADDACEIIYYAGTIASKANADLVPNQLNDGTSNYTVTGIKRYAFRKAINKDAGQTSVGVNVDLTNCTKVENDAFKGNLTIKVLSLGNVYNIGSSAFEGTNIIYSAVRPNSFSGMLELGNRAFAKATISGGILDLHGVSNNKYAPGESVLAGLIFSGTYGTENAVLDLQNINTIPGNFTSGAKIRADILLNYVETVADGAFNGVIYANDTTTPTNIVDARDVRVIGENAFYGIQCNTLYLGTHDATLKDDKHPYVSIIGATSGVNIQTLVLDGQFLTTDEPALASAESSEIVTIDTLQLTHTTTEIPQYTFATGRTVNTSHEFTMNPNLIINDVKTFEEVSSETVYASFDIGAYAFRGAGFNSDEKDFEGVVNIGEHAFESSTIVSLNLGNSIESIAAENFIWYCDSISTLTIERSVPSSEIDPDSEEQQYFPEYMVTLGGVAAADEKISHTGEKLESFKIVVDTNLVTTYVNDTVWTGWKDYFQPLVYYVDSGNNRWYVTIIDPNDSSRGCHVIGWERIDKSRAPIISLAASLTIPGKGRYTVTAFGTDEDMFKELTDDENVSTFYISTFAFTNIKTLNAKAFQSPKLTHIQNPSGAHGTGAAIKWNYENTGTDRYILYKRGYGSGTTQKRELYKIFSKAAATEEFTIPADVYKIKSGAFSGTTQITTVKLAANSILQSIEADAFDKSNIKTFDFTNSKRVSFGDIENQMIYAPEDAFGPAREQVLDPATGHYYYKANTDISITVPQDLLTKYQNDSTYAMYNDYGLLHGSTSGTSVSNASETKQQNSLKQNEANVTVSGVTYHIMNSGTEYQGTTYTSAKTKFVAVVTGLNKQTASSAVVIIPSTVSVKGINYEVIVIADGAFGENDVLETLVLPNKEVSYSSVAFDGCSKLGVIQYNDIVAYTESAKNTVAALPEQSTKSLLESSTDESED